MDSDIKGTGNHLSFGGYGYDRRTGVRWNVDLKADDYLNWSAYAAFGNNSINFTDPEGTCIVGPDGECVNIFEKNGMLMINGDLSEETTEMLNAIWKTKIGKNQVRYLMKTSAKITVTVSEDVWFYKSELQLDNLDGIHEVQHTKSENIKIREEVGEPETPVFNIEDHSRKELEKLD